MLIAVAGKLFREDKSRIDGKGKREERALGQRLYRPARVGSDACPLMSNLTLICAVET